MTKKYDTINVTVGSLPEWYLEDESNYDYYLEEAIVNRLDHLSDIITIDYAYQGSGVIKFYSNDGDLISAITHDYNYALDYAQKMNN